MDGCEFSIHPKLTISQKNSGSLAETLHFKHAYPPRTAGKHVFYDTEVLAKTQKPLPSQRQATGAGVGGVVLAD